MYPLFYYQYTTTYAKREVSFYAKHLKISNTVNKEICEAFWAICNSVYWTRLRIEF